MGRTGTTFMTGLLGVLAGAALVGGIVWAWDDGDGGSNTAVAQPTASSGATNTSANTSNSASTGTDLSSLYDRVRPSIVRITTGETTTDPFSDQASGLGSGIVLDKDGHILTNYHVVRGFDEVT